MGGDASPRVIPHGGAQRRKCGTQTHRPFRRAQRIWVPDSRYASSGMTAYARDNGSGIGSESPAQNAELVTTETIIEKGRAMMKIHPHPGELLREDVLAPLGIEVTDAAGRLGMSRTALSRVLNGHAGISPDLAVRLERAGVSTARFWLTLQSNFELSLATQRVQPQVVAIR